MDEVQKKVCRITELIPNCLSDRRILQSGLSDILVDDRLHINLLMAAYDENIVGKLNGEKDSTIAANYLIRQLHNSYGFDNSLCVWTVVTWLFILKRDDEAIQLFNMQTFETEKYHRQEQSSFFCTYCGNRLSGKEEYCSRCGKRRLTPESISSTAPQNTSTNDSVYSEYVNHIAESEVDTSNSEIEEALARLDSYKETGEYEDDYILKHKDTILKICRSNYPQRYGAHLVMGECNMEGTFGKRDIEAAKRFYIESIKGSTPMPVAEIQLFNIFYRFEPDYDKSHFYCESAINHGDPTGSVYLAREFLCEEAIMYENRNLLFEAVPVCFKGASMRSVPPYRDKYAFWTSRYICAVMGQIITLAIKDEKNLRLFNGLISELKDSIIVQFNKNPINDWWFEDTVVFLLTKVVELSDKQLLMIDLTNNQRKRIRIRNHTYNIVKKKRFKFS